MVNKHILLVMEKCKWNHYVDPLEWLISKRPTIPNGDNVMQLETSYTVGM